MRTPNILILGSSGNIGKHLFSRLGSDAAVATYCNTVLPGAVRFDSLTMDVADILDEFPSIDRAVLLLGQTDPEVCIKDPEHSEKLNVESIKRVIDRLVSRGMYLVFMSSEFVFDGVKGTYSEQDPPSPILLYGVQKLKIEDYLEKTYDRFAILRLSKAVGEFPNDGTLFSNWIDATRGGSTTMRCADDQRFSPILIADVVEGIIRAMETDCRGTFHLSGPAAYTRLELLEMLLSHFQRYESKLPEVVRCSIHDFPLAEKRPVDVSMRSDKLVAATGLQLTGMDEVCQRLLERYFSPKGSD